MATSQLIDNQIRSNVQKLMDEILECTNRASQMVELMAVSKTYPIAYVHAAILGGIKLFGENRVQEVEKKFYTHIENTGTDTVKDASDIRNAIELHLIGSLQKNKVKKALQYFDCIESIDSQSLIDKCHNVLNTLGKREGYKIFLQVCCSNYDYKKGFSEYNRVRDAVGSIVDCNLLRIQGLMTIAPFTNDEKIVRGAFAKARVWKEEIEREFHLKDLRLSMGMSGDYKWAIEEGSHIVRVGTAIFGMRNYE